MSLTSRDRPAIARIFANLVRSWPTCREIASQDALRELSQLEAYRMEALRGADEIASSPENKKLDLSTLDLVRLQGEHLRIWFLDQLMSAHLDSQDLFLQLKAEIDDAYQRCILRNKSERGPERGPDFKAYYLNMVVPSPDQDEGEVTREIDGKHVPLNFKISDKKRRKAILYKLWQAGEKGMSRDQLIPFVYDVGEVANTKSSLRATATQLKPILATIGLAIAKSRKGTWYTLVDQGSLHGSHGGVDQD